MTDVQPKPISRRTVAKGAAWTAPVILGGVAAPAYAASGTKPSIVPGPSCKQPGNSCNKDFGISKGYVFIFTITNLSAKDVWLYTGGAYPNNGPEITTTGVDAIPLTYAGGRIGGVYYAPGTHIPVPAGGTVTFLLGVNGEADSSNRVFSMHIKFQWGHTALPAGDVEHKSDPLTSTVDVSGTPPCDKCAPPADAAAAIAAANKAQADASSSSTSTSTMTSSSTSSAAATTPPTTDVPATQPSPTSTTAP